MTSKIHEIDQETDEINNYLTYNCVPAIAGSQRISVKTAFEQLYKE